MSVAGFNPVVYRLSRGLVRFGLRLWCRLNAREVENVPATGGCIIASNHVSYLDPPAIGCTTMHRFINFMARDSLFRFRLSNWYFTGMGCIPVDRDKGDAGVLRKCLHLLKQGRVIVIFPEGTRSHDGQIQPVKGGIGFLAAKAGVPVVPVYIDGTFKALPRRKFFIRPATITVYYGKPIQVNELSAQGNDRTSYELISDLIMSRIKAINPAYSGK